MKKCNKKYEKMKSRGKIKLLSLEETIENAKV